MSQTSRSSHPKAWQQSTGAGSTTLGPSFSAFVMTHYCSSRTSCYIVLVMTGYTVVFITCPFVMLVVEDYYSVRNSALLCF